ncbi:flagellar hook-associated protein FlgL [Spongiibacter sp.]|uniref:flagellar hook-associated protein FlgL n=1 Tax=Spongiibacter sp. TaxID=2024860 RepID=UPI0035619206
MRISTAQIYSAGLTGMLDQQSKLLETQTQLATGQRRLSPADDPVGAVRSLELSRSLDRSEQFQRNAVVLDNRLRMEESVLAEGVEILQRVRTLTLQANNAAQSNESRAAIARELEQQTDSLMSLANTRDSDGRYVFSGYQQDVQAFSRDANGFRYNGDDGQRMLQVGLNRQLADTSPGSELFMGIANGNGRFQATASAANSGQGFIDAGAVADLQQYAGDAIDIVFTAADQYELRDSSAVVIASGSYRSGDSIDVAGMTVKIEGEPASGDTFYLRPSEAQDVFSMVSGLAQLLAQPRSGGADRALQTSQINTSLAGIDQALSHLVAKQADTGARMQALDRQRDINDSVNLQVQQNLSVINDLDYAEAVSRFEQQRLGLQAAQQAFAKVQGLSLFNYL